MSEEPGRKSSKWGLWIGLLVIGCTLMGTLGGAAAGALTGYLVGRRATGQVVLQRLGIEQAAPRRFRFEIPVPEFQEPDFDMPERLLDFEGGALVKEVVEGGPADEAGLREGDLITRIDGERIAPALDLARLVRTYEPGDHVELKVNRDGDELTIDLRMGEDPDVGGKAYVGIYYEMVFSGRLEAPYRRRVD